MADLQTVLDELDNTLRRLNQQWEATTAVWDDAVQREFAERYWQPLTREHGAAAKSAALLAQTLLQVRRNIS